MDHTVSLPLLNHPAFHPREILTEDGGHPTLLVPPAVPGTSSKIILPPVLSDNNSDTGKPNFVIHRFPNGAVCITRPLD